MDCIFPWEKMYIPTLTRITEGEEKVAVRWGLRFPWAGCSCSGCVLLRAKLRTTSVGWRLFQHDENTRAASGTEAPKKSHPWKWVCLVWRIHRAGHNWFHPSLLQPVQSSAWVRRGEKSMSEGKPGFRIQSSIYNNYTLYNKLL